MRLVQIKADFCSTNGKRLATDDGARFKVFSIDQSIFEDGVDQGNVPNFKDQLIFFL